MKTRKGYKVYPLTAAQRYHEWYIASCPKKQMLNIGSSVTIGADVDHEVLKRAIYKAYDRCESMRLRFVKDKEGITHQYVVEKEDRPIDSVDFTGLTMEQAEDIMRSWTEVPFDHNEKPLNRVTIIRTPDGFNGLYLLVDHMTMDGQSLIMFVKDIIELYCHELDPNSPEPKEMTSYIKQVQKDLAYENGSKAQLRDRDYFEEMIKSSEPIYNDIDGPEKLMRQRKENDNLKQRAYKKSYDSVDSKFDVFHLEEEPTKRLLEFCEEYHVPIISVLMMGLRTYFQKMNFNDDVSFNTMIARRATLQEKFCGGNRFHMFPFRTIISRDKTFLDGVNQIRDQQNEMFRHANFDSAEYLTTRSQYYNLESGMTYEPMSLTYQPLTAKENGITNLGDIPYKSKWYSNGATTQAIYLTVMHRQEDNGLDFNFEHQINTVSAEKLEFMYYYVCKIMFKGIENPNLSVGEIINLV